MMTKTTIVTGAAGNLGRAVVNKLVENNYKVIGTVRKKSLKMFPSQILKK